MSDQQYSFSTEIRNAWLSEIQAIAIYEAECLVLRRTGFTSGRRTSRALCEAILVEEKEHSSGLRSYLEARAQRGMMTLFSRAAGYLLGIALACLPSTLSWRAHLWAENAAADIYRDAARSIHGRAGPALRALLEHAERQEREHAERFGKLIPS